MSGEKNLDKLLSCMSPSMIEGEFVFVSFEQSKYGDHAHLNPIASMLEAEGLTLIVAKQSADEHDLHYDSTFKGITLNIHSSLDAVGLTAAFATKLAQHEISANVVAGYFHDHIFVGCADAERALSALMEIET